MIYQIPVERNRNTKIYKLSPHYTDDRFKRAQTVYLARGEKLQPNGYVKGATYNYSDRLMQHFGWDKYQAAWEAAKESGLTQGSAACLEVYLRHITGDNSLYLVHIQSGFNPTNGNPYQVFGYMTRAAQS